MDTGAEQQRRPPRGQPRKGLEGLYTAWVRTRAWMEHRTNLYSQRVQRAIQKKQIKRSKRKRKRGWVGRRLARAAARLTRKRQKAALVKVATYNVRSLSVKGANGYGRDEVVLHEAAAKNIAVLGI